MYFWNELRKGFLGNMVRANPDITKSNYSNLPWHRIFSKFYSSRWGANQKWKAWKFISSTADSVLCLIHSIFIISLSVDSHAEVSPPLRRKLCPTYLCPEQGFFLTCDKHSNKKLINEFVPYCSDYEVK